MSSSFGNIRIHFLNALIKHIKQWIPINGYYAAPTPPLPVPGRKEGTTNERAGVRFELLGWLSAPLPLTAPHCQSPSDFVCSFVRSFVRRKNFVDFVRSLTSFVRSFVRAFCLFPSFVRSFVRRKNFVDFVRSFVDFVRSLTSFVR